MFSIKENHMNKRMSIGKGKEVLMDTYGQINS